MYKERSDKEIIENLEFCDNYEDVYLIKSLKKQVSNLKREVTNLKKKTKVIAI